MLLLVSEFQSTLSLNSIPVYLYIRHIFIAFSGLGEVTLCPGLPGVIPVYTCAHERMQRSSSLFNLSISV